MKTVDSELFRKLSELLKSVKGSISIIPHVNPDGDAIGAAIGLSNALVNAGYNVSIVCPNDYPEYYNWFANKAEILLCNKQKKKAVKTITNSELLICVDFNDIKRAGDLSEYIQNFNGTKLLIDHHPNPGDFCNYIISDKSYSSTSEMIYDVLLDLGMESQVDQSVAEALFAGIMTDTGSFSHNISDPNTFNVVSRLLAMGINADDIHAKVYHNFSADRMKLLGYGLNEKMVVLPEFNTAFISLSKEELDRFNFKPGDTEGFVNYPLSIKGIVFSVLFLEKQDHVKLSLRSKGRFPANKFAADNFDGGGHLNAAGGESKLNLFECIEKFKQLLPQYSRQLINA